jgi:hypothetical protein
MVPATLVALAGPAAADPLLHGDHSGSTVHFAGVAEDSATDPVPLFGTPRTSGNTLAFDPVFAASASGGSADRTEGTITCAIEALSGSLDQITIDAAGLWSLSGSGSAASAVRWSVAISLRITDTLDGPLGTAVTTAGNLSFTPAASAMLAGPLTGDWTGSKAFNLASTLAFLGLGRATRVELTLTGLLLASSEAGSTASASFAATDGLRITVVPAPGAAGLLAAAAVFAARRRR